VLHRFVREPLELDRKWMSKAHLTLRHYQARRVYSATASTSAISENTDPKATCWYFRSLIGSPSYPRYYFRSNRAASSLLFLPGI
jgi:hypothetical protein